MIAQSVKDLPNFISLNIPINSTDAEKNNSNICLIYLNHFKEANHKKKTFVINYYDFLVKRYTNINSKKIEKKITKKSKALLKKY